MFWNMYTKMYVPFVDNYEAMGYVTNTFIIEVIASWS